MSPTPPAPLPQRLGLTVLEGPQRVGSELRWRVRDGDTEAVLGQLLPELAHEPSLRRRYVRDIERLRGLGSEGLAAIRRHGPQPDPRDPEAPAPWRLRDDPAGETLEHWLERRAPAPIDEAAGIVAALAERVHALHGKGAVLRDLHPRLVVIGEDGSLWLTDVGLARVDVLSTRTAASLILEGSPYVAPELLVHTVVDQRADLYGLGVILFRALTGTLPWGDSTSLLRPSGAPPRVRKRRPEVPRALDALVARCLAEDPAQRPGSAAELADALRGRMALPDDAPRLACQSCGTPLRMGQRLCTQCGKLAVQFTTAKDDEGWDVQLRKIDEDATSRAQLREILGAVAADPLPALNFMVGDARMYSKEEQKRYIKLPAVLVANLDRDSADRLDERLRAAGLQTRVVAHRSGGALASRRRAGLIAGFGFAAVAVVGVAMLVAGAVGAGVAIITVLIAAGIAAGVAKHNKHRTRTQVAVLPRIRRSPSALPASDPLVARLAALLVDDTPADLREQIGELALTVQRLVDHRGSNRRAREEIDAVTAPVAELVELVELQVQAIARIDAELKTLDEGALVRALAAAEARREPPAVREELLEGLDRLRALEDARSRRFHGLLEASRLARRSLELGLEVVDEQQAHEREIAAALAALGPASEDEIDGGGDDDAPRALAAPPALDALP